MTGHKKETIYTISWQIGSVLCAGIYYSGILFCYECFRKKLLKRYRTHVLMYHRIRNDGRDSDISVSTRNFQKQMQYLKQNLNVVSLNTLVNNIRKGAYIPADRLAITFDDGYKDNFLNAYPVLKKYKLPATIFLISQFVGDSEDMLNTSEITIMKKDNIDFGSHTATHKILAEADLETVSRELIDSKKDIEYILKEKVDFFAYPKGKREHFNNHIKEQVKKVGYRAAFVTENGEITSSDDLFELKRIGIRNYPLFVFQVRLSGLLECRPVYFIRKCFGLT